MNSAIDAASVANWVSGSTIAGLQERIQVEEALRSVTFAPSHALDAAQSAAAAPPAPLLTVENEQGHQSD